MNYSSKGKYCTFLKFTLVTFLQVKICKVTYKVLNNDDTHYITLQITIRLDLLEFRFDLIIFFFFSRFLTFNSKFRFFSQFNF